MYVCGVQIARRDVLNCKCSYTQTQPPHQRTEGNQWCECGRAK